MREIEFRGKDLLGKWRYGDLIQEKWKSKLNTNEKAYMIKNGNRATTVLQELEELQQKEKSRIIGNIYEIKIEDLEPVLKPYYISKEKAKKKMEDLKKAKERNVKRDFDTVYKDGYYSGGIDAIYELLEDK